MAQGFRRTAQLMALLALGAVLVAPPASAARATPAPTASDTDDEHECACRHGYTPHVSITLGGSWEHYTGETLQTRNAGASIASAAHYDLDFDFGFYFRPATDNLVFGIALDLATDSWSNDPLIARVGQFFIGAKALYSFSGEFGRGPYVHGDLGPVVFSNQVGNVTGRTIQSTQTGSPLGIGVRLGAGYAFKVSQHLSLLAIVDWSYRTAGAASAMPVTLGGGFLF
jgi:hypothetical protein